jgi:hypothetical protein
METISCWRKEGKQYIRKVLTFYSDVMDPETALAQDLDFPYNFPGWYYEKADNEIKGPNVGSKDFERWDADTNGEDDGNIEENND